MTLTKGSRKLFEWLRTQDEGTIVSYENIQAVTDWSESSLLTYISKNKITPFLLPLEGKRLKVLLAGDEIQERYFGEMFTQTAPRLTTLYAGQKLDSDKATYKLDEPLGNGAIGHVWSAQTDNKQKVAIKVMLPRTDLLQASKLPNVRERFYREAENGQNLNHENIVRYLDVGKIEKNPFLVMELADNSAGASLKLQGAFSGKQAAKIIKYCAKGLEYLHDRDCQHRDVKPDNILEFSGTIKLADLGIVKWSDFDPTFTKGGTITTQSIQLGSWFYMAPEQQESPHDVVSASDIYALGVTWIEILTKSLPSPQSVIAGNYQLPAVKPDVAKIIKAMCSFRPDQRPSVDDILSTISSAYP